jgi:hypothetical protein
MSGRSTTIFSVGKDDKVFCSVPSWMKSASCRSVLATPSELEAAKLLCSAILLQDGIVDYLMTSRSFPELRSVNSALEIFEEKNHCTRFSFSVLHLLVRPHDIVLANEQAINLLRHLCSFLSERILGGGASHPPLMGCVDSTIEARLMPRVTPDGCVPISGSVVALDMEDLITVDGRTLLLLRIDPVRSPACRGVLLSSSACTISGCHAKVAPFHSISGKICRKHQGALFQSNTTRHTFLCEGVLVIPICADDDKLYMLCCPACQGAFASPMALEKRCPTCTDNKWTSPAPDDADADADDHARYLARLALEALAPLKDPTLAVLRESPAVASMCTMNPPRIMTSAYLSLMAVAGDHPCAVQADPTTVRSTTPGIHLFPDNAFWRAIYEVHRDMLCVVPSDTLASPTTVRAQRDPRLDNHMRAHLICDGVTDSGEVLIGLPAELFLKDSELHAFRARLMKRLLEIAAECASEAQADRSFPSFINRVTVDLTTSRRAVLTNNSGTRPAKNAINSIAGALQRMLGSGTAGMHPTGVAGATLELITSSKTLQGMRFCVKEHQMQENTEVKVDADDDGFELEQITRMLKYGLRLNEGSYELLQLQDKEERKVIQRGKAEPELLQKLEAAVRLGATTANLQRMRSPQHPKCAGVNLIQRIDKDIETVTRLMEIMELHVLSACDDPQLNSLLSEWVAEPSKLRTQGGGPGRHVQPEVPRDEHLWQRLLGASPVPLRDAEEVVRILPTLERFRPWIGHLNHTQPSLFMCKLAERDILFSPEILQPPRHPFADPRLAGFLMPAANQPLVCVVTTTGGACANNAVIVPETAGALEIVIIQNPSPDALVRSQQLMLIHNLDPLLLSGQGSMSWQGILHNAMCLPNISYRDLQCKKGLRLWGKLGKTPRSINSSVDLPVVSRETRMAMDANALMMDHNNHNLETCRPHFMAAVGDLCRAQQCGDPLTCAVSKADVAMYVPGAISTLSREAEIEEVKLIMRSQPREVVITCSAEPCGKDTWVHALHPDGSGKVVRMRSDCAPTPESTCFPSEVPVGPDGHKCFASDVALLQMLERHPWSPPLLNHFEIFENVRLARISGLCAAVGCTGHCEKLETDVKITTEATPICNVGPVLSSHSIVTFQAAGMILWNAVNASKHGCTLKTLMDRYSEIMTARQAATMLGLFEGKKKLTVLEMTALATRICKEPIRYETAQLLVEKARIAYQVNHEAMYL